MLNWISSSVLFVYCIVCFYGDVYRIIWKRELHIPSPTALPCWAAELLCILGTRPECGWLLAKEVFYFSVMWIHCYSCTQTHSYPHIHFHILLVPWDLSHFCEHHEGIQPTTEIYIKPIQRAPQCTETSEPLRKTQTVITSDFRKAKETKMRESFWLASAYRIPKHFRKCIHSTLHND